MSKLPRFDGRITSLNSAISVLEEIQKDKDFVDIPKRPGPRDTFPFGIWFRGQADARWPLLPKVFRDHEPVDGTEDKRLLDETNLYTHSRVRLPDYHVRYRERFDWLCLMQHYDLATRLLDWSESLLIALYFAVRGANLPNREEKSAALVVLNARRLNRSATRRYNISNPESREVKLRAEMTFHRDRPRLEESLKEQGFRRRLDTFKLDQPVAVYPNRLNERMIFQSSVFTLHGGKVYRGDDSTPRKQRLPKPVALEDVRDKEKVPILRYYEISPDCARKIEDGLFKLGIHEGSLFPEIDKQAVYLQRIW